MKILYAGGIHLGEWKTFHQQALHELQTAGKITQFFPRYHNGDWMWTQTLSDMGHEVIQFNYRLSYLIPFETAVKENRLWDIYASFSSDTARAREEQEAMNTALLNVAQQEKPDFFLTFLGERIYPETIAELQASDVTTVFWHERNFLHEQMPNTKASLPYYDFVFTYDPGLINVLKDAGVPDVHYLPFGCYPPLHRKMSPDEFDYEAYQTDVAFCGTLMPGRVEFLRDIADTGVEFWTRSWNDTLAKKFPELVPRYRSEVRGLSMVQLLNAAKIVLNPHHITSSITGTNMRTFEAGGSQAFLLSDYKPELERMFRIGEEIEVYHSLDELKKKITYYLEHPDEREGMARRLQQKMYAEHTYHHRFQEMIDVISAR